MRPKLHTPPDLQLLVNTVMPWAEARLQEQGQIPAAAAWLAKGDPEPKFRSADPVEGFSGQSVAQQEAMLVTQLRGPWQRGELAAVLLAAPVFFGRSGSGERSLAIRLHVEAQNEDQNGAQTGSCADILMPYRIRTGWRWRGTARNRVHFTHPVAQESDSRFQDSPAPL
jgi:hypothetical protein